MKSICLYTRDANPLGIKVILDNVKKKLNGIDIPIISDIEEAIKYDVVLPYGLLEPVDLMKEDKTKCKMVLMVDATSLINLSQFKYYKDKKILPFKARYIELLRYWYHVRLEKKVFKTFDDVILVSYGDKKYFEGIKDIKPYTNKISVIQNGVDLPSNAKLPREKDEKIVLGFLRSWGRGKSPMHPEEICFLEYVWKGVQKLNPNIKLKFCGKGMSPQQKEYCSGFENVECVGEVKDLADYFNQIDINLMIMPKHGGILNKMLDGFAYKCPTIGEPHNFYAFKDLPDCYYTYSDAKSLVASAERINSNPIEVGKKVEMAYDYVKENHNWHKNYEPLSEKIMRLL